MNTIKQWLAFPFRALALLQSIDNRLAVLESTVSKPTWYGGSQQYPVIRTGKNKYEY